MRPRRTRPLAAAVLMLPPGLRDDRRTGEQGARNHRATFQHLWAVVPPDATSMVPRLVADRPFRHVWSRAPVRSVTGSEEYKMDNTGSGTRLPRSSSVNVSRRALRRVR